MFKFIIYCDRSGKFRFRMVGNNHEILNDNYNQLENAKDCVKLIKNGAAEATVFLQDEDGNMEEITV